VLRLFTAITLPAAIAQRLARMGGGIPGARWVAEENLHLTLRFIGETDRHAADRVHEALGAVVFSPFEVRLQGTATFGERKPRLLYAGVAASPELLQLYEKVVTALSRAGVASPNGRRYVPHVTLARLNNAPRDRIGGFIAENNILNIAPFRAEHFVLMSSHASAKGASYQIEARYPVSRNAVRAGLPD
jgi:RNA 2',3'-cyclic 3'-phosphodiesterase